MAFDFKKSEKQYYDPGNHPVIVEIPEMNFLMVDGQGDPNTSPEYQSAVQALYGMAYAIRMEKSWPGYFEYVVPPLEGLWEVRDTSFKGGGQPLPDKSLLVWTAMIRQPEFVTADIFLEAREILAKKKPELDTSRLRLERFREGLCAQILHRGSYDEEPGTIAILDAFIRDSGHEPDFSDSRHHHEIYLSDPRRTAPEKLKTVLRHPVR